MIWFGEYNERINQKNILLTRVRAHNIYTKIYLFCSQILCIKKRFKLSTLLKNNNTMVFEVRITLGPMVIGIVNMEFIKPTYGHGFGFYHTLQTYTIALSIFINNVH